MLNGFSCTYKAVKILFKEFEHRILECIPVVDIDRAAGHAFDLRRENPAGFGIYFVNDTLVEVISQKDITIAVELLLKCTHFAITCVTFNGDFLKIISPLTLRL